MTMQIRVSALRFEALEESFSKTLHELSRAKRITHMHSQNHSYFHLRWLLYMRKEKKLFIALLSWCAK